MLKYIILLLLIINLINATNKLNKLNTQFKALHPNPPIAYQAHGVNDIGAWPQYLMKGSKWFKSDVALASFVSCSNYSNWQGNKDDCINDACCIALRGDVSSIPNLNIPFNISDDFISLIEDKQYRHYFADPNNEIVAQLYFSFGEAFQEPQKKLFVDFLVKLNTTIYKNNLNLKIMTKGLLNQADVFCMDESNVNCTEFEKQLTQLPVATWPGYNDFKQFPPIDPKKRLQIFNTGWSHFQDLCTENFPNHTGHDNYPYTWVEPSTQQEIASVMNVQLSCKNLPANHKSISDGMRVTCNQNVEMFEVFAANWTKIGDNTILSNSMINATHPRSVIMEEMLSSNNKSKWLSDRYIISTYNNKDNQSMLSINDVVNENRKVYNSIKLSHIIDTLSRANKWILGTTNDGLYFLWEFNGISASVTLISSGTLLKKSKNTTFFATSLLCDDNDKCNILSAENSSICSLSLSLYSLCSQQVCNLVPIENQCVVKNHSISEATLSAATSVDTSNAFDGLFVYGAIESEYNKPALYYGYMQISNLEKFNLIITNPKYHFDYGTQPHINLRMFNKKLYAMEVHTDGKCSWGYAINNGNIDHCRIASGVSSPALLNVNSLLNYNFAPLTNFIDVIKSEGVELSSTCSDLVFNGKYDTGREPTVALSQNPNTGELEFFELHDANVPASMVTKTLCGNPIRKYGPVIDQFLLPQPY